jgi:hypothetical protein
LALGLKAETADMVHFFSRSLAQDWTIVPLAENETARQIQDNEIPAWSLHRLWELANIKYIILDSEDEIAVLYDEVIMKIEQFIKDGYFNKEYLQEQADSSREE